MKFLIPGYRHVAAVTLVAGLAFLGAGAAKALDKVTIGTNWLPEVEHGGLYQAKATGLFKDYGLDAEIVPGGPQVNNAMLLLSGKMDFILLHTSGQVIAAAQEGAPMVAVASFYQKDPQVIVSHKNVGHDTLESLKGVPVMLSQDSLSSFWPWLKQKYGYADDQVRPYTFQQAPFLSDAQAVQQSYLTAEPFAIKQAGVEPNIFLLSDYGWNTYATLLVTRRDVIEKNPDLVKRVVRATLEGWYSFFADPEPAKKLVHELEPDMSYPQMEYSIEEMKKNGIVISGDVSTLGVGAMTEKRWDDFYKQMMKAGVYKDGLDLKKVYSLDYVNDPAFLAKMKEKYPGVVE